MYKILSKLGFLSLGLLIPAASIFAQKKVEIKESIFDGERYIYKKLDDSPLSGKATITLSEHKKSEREYGDWFASKGQNLKAKAFDDEYNLKVFHETEMLEEYYAPLRALEHNKATYYLYLAIEQDNQVLLLYGNPPNELHLIKDVAYLAVYDKKDKKISHILDVSALGLAPDYLESNREFVFQSIRWAYLENNLLYISQSHWTYANSSYGLNAYITAIDLNKKRVLWRSQPLVSNASNFVVLDRAILSAYGFSREEGKVYALDKATGVVVGEAQLYEKSSEAQQNPLFLLYQKGKLSIKLGNKDELDLRIEGIH